MTPLLPLLLALVSNQSQPAEAKSFFQADLFPTLVNPSCSHCVDEAKRRIHELRVEDPVLCWTRGYSNGGVIPIRFFLNSYRVISDSYGVFIYDPDGGFARGFAPSYQFTFHGWRNGIMVMKHQDGTLYSSLSGEAFDGPRKGDRLKVIPVISSTWGKWSNQYPEAVAYHMFEKYKPTEIPTEENLVSVKTRGKPDKRLDGQQLILGVRFENQIKAYPLENLKPMCLVEDNLADEPIIILKEFNSTAAYKPVAHQPRIFKGPNPDPTGVSPFDSGKPLPLGTKELPTRRLTFIQQGNTFKDRETGTLWDVAGRGLNGELKGWTLEPLDSIVCKWVAWSAEFPETTIFNSQAKLDPNAKVKEIAGTAEFLRILPKPFGTVKSVETKANAITLIMDQEGTPKTWPIEPDAEIKVGGTWGRLEQFKPGQRVWVWLKLDRKKTPVSIVMIADDVTEEDMHGTLSNKRKPNLKYSDKQIEILRSSQQNYLRSNWEKHGLPGTLTFHHVFSGELEITLDHEAMRWARSLLPGDTVFLPGEPEIKAVVKNVKPWRERTVIQLVVGELEASEMRIGQRVGLKMKTPEKDWLQSPYPPDLGKAIGKIERIDWFLASIYCTCGVSKDICTGHFYTLSSCNPNGCGLPKSTRDEISVYIDQGKTDLEIWNLLLKDRGSLMVKPHLMP